MTNHTVKAHGAAWAVFLDGTPVSQGHSNSDAWRIADKLNREPATRKEETAEWISRKNET